MNKFLKISLIGFSFLSLVLVGKAAGLDVRGPEQGTAVTFPIAELGNCNNKQECKTYCDKAENISVCATFAQNHGLITVQEKQQADKLSSALKKSAGPGGCTDAATCKTFCSDSSHIDECVAFAQAHDLIPKEKLEGARKIGQALKQGAGPGGCKNENDCRTFCSKSENQQTCQDFAKKQGLVSQEDAAKLDKFSELVKAGQTPGACTTKDECRTYCQDQTHKDECLQFLVKLGGINQQAADKIKQTGNKGPGGCDSKDACETYCNDSTHQQECVQFAEEHGLIKQEDAHDIKQGQANAQIGISNAPAEVKACLEEKVEPDTLAQLESGLLTPTADVAGDVKDCFEKYKPEIKQEFKQKLQQNPNLQKCLETAVGSEAVNEISNGQVPDDSSITQKMRPCFTQALKPVPALGSNGEHGSSTRPNLPPEQLGLRECLVRILGAEAVKNMTTVSLTDEQKTALEKCRPLPGRGEGGFEQGHGTSTSPQRMPPLPTQTNDSQRIRNCLTEKLGSDNMAKLSDPAARNSETIQSALKDCGYFPRPIPAQTEPMGGDHTQTAPGQNTTGTDRLPLPPQPKPPLGGEQHLPTQQNSLQIPK